MVKKDAVVKATILEFYNAIKNVYLVKKIILYGSYAKGNMHNDSDIDIAVIIDLPASMDRIKVTSRLFHFARVIDVDIEPLCIPWSEYQNHEPASIIGEIIRSGIEIV